MKIKVKTTAKKTTLSIPHWGPYNDHQRQLKTLWDWFLRLCQEGDMTWTRIEGQPFEKGGNGTIEGGCGNRNAVFSFRVENGRVVRGLMF